MGENQRLFYHFLVSEQQWRRYQFILSSRYVVKWFSHLTGDYNVVASSSSKAFTYIASHHPGVKEVTGGYCGLVSIVCAISDWLEISCFMYVSFHVLSSPSMQVIIHHYFISFHSARFAREQREPDGRPWEPGPGRSGPGQGEHMYGVEYSHTDHISSRGRRHQDNHDHYCPSRHSQLRPSGLPHWGRGVGEGERGTL